MPKDTDYLYPTYYVCGNCSSYMIPIDGTDEDYERARPVMEKHRKACRVPDKGTILDRNKE